MQLTLTLDSGKQFQVHDHQLFGSSANIPIQGELVFQTGMTGYIETLTDPSYAGQILVCTYPHQGNYGVPSPANPSAFESSKIWPKAVIIADYVDDKYHFEAHKSLSAWLAEHNVLGITGLDTRQLTREIRDSGRPIIATIQQGTGKSQLLVQGDCLQSSPEGVQLMDFRSSIGRGLQAIPLYDKSAPHGTVCTGLLAPNPVPAQDLLLDTKTRLLLTQVNNHYHPATPRILFIDMGAKTSQITRLSKWFNIDIIPYDYPCQQVKLVEYCGIFLSNGPGDPKKASNIIDFIKSRIMDQDLHIPVFGICLGHQVLALSAGHDTQKMAYGHRGQNIPVLFVSDIKSGFITSQNHGYEVILNPALGGWSPLFINGNDNTVEGITSTTKPWFSVQFHPEARPGPEDASWLFEVFRDMVEDYARHPGCNLVTNIKSHIRSHYLTPIPETQRITSGKVIIIGSGGLQIGQAGEFDYSGSQALKAYKEAGLYTILVNPNIATIQTDMADKIYYVPITPAYIIQIIEELVQDSSTPVQYPIYISVSFGGQTALNTGMALQESGILAKYNIQVLGTPLQAVKQTEDRTLFKSILESKLDIYCPPSKSCVTIEEAIDYASMIGYPVLARAGYCLGGQGSGFAYTPEDLSRIFTQAQSINSISNPALDPASNPVLIDKSLHGWKEFELELVRDSQDNCICVCAMENMDPLGVHTGESIVVAPCQTLTDREFQAMRTMAFRIIRHLGIVGECNIQFCLNPVDGTIYVIEMNARLSRSSALASKATGYPLAYVAAKLGLGQILPEITNKVTGKTTAFFEPSLDYIVVKIPRWDLDKTPGVDPELGSAMKSVGETMAIGRNFREAIMKAIRSCGMFGQNPLSPVQLQQPLTHPLSYAHPGRLLDIIRALYKMSIFKHEILLISKTTSITPWFISQLSHIVNIIQQLDQNHNCSSSRLDMTNPAHTELIIEAKRNGFTDLQIASWLRCGEHIITDYRFHHNIQPHILQIDTVAGEFPAQTNYLYLSYDANASDPVIKSSATQQQAVIILGGGCYRIGSSVEFDWCAVTASRQVKKSGFVNIIINNNPETVSTDYDEADRLYFEEITAETVQAIYYAETNQLNQVVTSRTGSARPSLSVPLACDCNSMPTVKGVIVSMGGQTPNNIVMALSHSQIPILGTSPQMIDMAENRFKFSRMADESGIIQPDWAQLVSLEQISQFAEKVQYPVLVRPSYVLSGAGMAVIYNPASLSTYLESASQISPEHPVVVSKFIKNAKEIEVDAVAQNGKVVLLAIAEHVENAGTHSGDATLILPAQDLTETTINKIKGIVHKIAHNLVVSGPLNIQLMARDDQIYVIECNLRASRSMPFVSKTLNINFIDIATQIMLNPQNQSILAQLPKSYKFDRIGVKVAQFSWNKLPGSLIKSSVEMASTGEVACFGPNCYIAYLKALQASGFRIRKHPPTIYTYTLTPAQSAYLAPSIKYLKDIGVTISQTLDSSVDLVLCCQPESPMLDEQYVSTVRYCQSNNIPAIINYKVIQLFCKSYYYYMNMASRVDSYFDTLDKNNKPAQSRLSHQLPQHILSPTIIANSLQCVEYLPESPPDSQPHPQVEIVFTDKHILSVQQFSRNLLRQIFRRASQYRLAKVSATPYPRPLSNKLIGLCFYTPSTRTRCSYESAIKRLGGDVMYIGAHESGVQKGESFYDTVRTLDSYVDGLVIRTPNDLQLSTYKNISRNPIINAGDMLEHPTQALLDLFTIREIRGTVNNLTYGFVGDCLNGRTIISLAMLLCNYNATLYFIPEPSLGPSPQLLAYLSRFPTNIKYHLLDEKSSFKSVIPKLDIIYMTRIQKERLIQQPATSPKTSLTHVLSPDVLIHAKPDAIILHPLPRNEELQVEIDMDPRSAYFQQMEYGLYLRMALVELLFGKEK